jgi:hypothetical protein
VSSYVVVGSYEEVCTYHVEEDHVVDANEGQQLAQYELLEMFIVVFVADGHHLQQNVTSR